MTAAPHDPVDQNPIDRHLPRPAEIESYGKGGFRFDGLSHRGSLLCLPDGIWASPITAVSQLDEAAFAPVFARSALMTHFLVGTGADLVPLGRALREAFRAHGMAVEAMTTGTAVSTWNILFEERRRVGALLIAVG